MTPHMQALTLVEYALGNWSKARAVKAVPALHRMTETELSDLAAVAETDYRRAEHVAAQLLDEKGGRA